MAEISTESTGSVYRSYPGYRNANNSISLRLVNDHEVRNRGKRTAPVVLPVNPGPFAAPIPMVGAQELEGVQDLQEPRYQSQASMNRVFTQAVTGPINKSNFDQQRYHFIQSFDSKKWNHPDEVLPQYEDKLEEHRALVIAIHYGRPEPLPATYVDAQNILNVLQTKFQYHEKCIRVLADRVDVNNKNRKDTRWPNKDNIVKGLEWLVEGTIPGSRRFLFFAGHGCTLTTQDDLNVYTNEGILPRDFLSIVDPESDVEKPDPETVLFDDVLNRCLVRIANGTKLTCCFSGGLTALVPETVDMSHLRRRTRFSTESIHDPAVLDRIYSDVVVNQSGNLLGLPSKLSLSTSDVDGVSRGDSNAMSWGPKVDGLDAPATANFTAFPDCCEVISWAACERNQSAREDGNSGGRFTSAFMEAILQSERDRITYRILNRRIHEQFEMHNLGIGAQNQNTSGPSQDAITRASKVQSVQGTNTNNNDQLQYPKLYVSENIKDKIADSQVYI